MSSNVNGCLAFWARAETAKTNEKAKAFQNMGGRFVRKVRQIQNLVSPHKLVSPARTEESLAVRFKSAIGSIIAAFVALAFLSLAGAQTLPKTMKAIGAHEYGGPEVLKYEDVPVPEPKENEILVRLIARGVNPPDPLILNGKYAKEFGTHLPLVLGYDMAGLVVKIGAKVTKLKVGDPVYAYLLWGGGWAEYCISNEGESAMKPKS